MTRYYVPCARCGVLLRHSTSQPTVRYCCARCQHTAPGRMSLCNHEAKR